MIIIYFHRTTKYYENVIFDTTNAACTRLQPAQLPMLLLKSTRHLNSATEPQVKEHGDSTEWSLKRSDEKLWSAY